MHFLKRFLITYCITTTTTTIYNFSHLILYFLIEIIILDFLGNLKKDICLFSLKILIYDVMNRKSKGRLHNKNNEE